MFPVFNEIEFVWVASEFVLRGIESASLAQAHKWSVRSAVEMSSSVHPDSCPIWVFFFILIFSSISPDYLYVYMKNSLGLPTMNMQECNQSHVIYVLLIVAVVVSGAQI